MEVRGKVVVVTGGGSGIGKAMCEAFAAEGAAGVVVADLDEASAKAVAQSIGGMAFTVDVASQSQVQALVDAATARFGRVDVFCSNAGIVVPGGADRPVADWQRIWEINVLAHVHAANAVLPQMIARGEGYLVNTASAAGLLSQVDSAAYATTKHAAVGFAEWLSIAHGDQGIRVSCLCPQGVLTPLLLGKDGKREAFLAATALTPERVAQDVLQAMRDEVFLVLPHPEVRTFMQRKVSDYDRWLGGMRRLRAKVMAGIQPIIKG